MDNDKPPGRGGDVVAYIIPSGKDISVFTRSHSLNLIGLWLVIPTVYDMSVISHLTACPAVGSWFAPLLAVMIFRCISHLMTFALS